MHTGLRIEKIYTYDKREWKETMAEDSGYLISK